MNISSNELSYLIFLNNDADDTAENLFSVETEKNVDIVAIFFDFLDSWKEVRYFVISLRNALMTAFNEVLSITQFDEKKKPIKSVDADLICRSLNLTVIDLNLMLLIKLRLFCRFVENSTENSFW